MKLFCSGTISAYVEQSLENMKAEIQRFSDTEITTCDFEQWADYFVSKYSISEITLFENSTQKTISPTKVRRYNYYHRYEYDEPEYFIVDGYTIGFTVPFDGDAQILRLTGSTFNLNTFEVASFSEPRGSQYGSFTLEFSYTESELTQQADVNTYVQNQFNSHMRDLKSRIDYNNSDVQMFNAKLHEKAIQFLTERRRKADTFATLSQALSIPMKIGSNAPNIVPIPLKRIEKTPVVKPTTKPVTPEYCISDEDYSNIIRIIHSACSSMERTPGTYNIHGEEELRDVTLAFLETHYENHVSGETFRKNGKTDILVSFENKAAFIGECKIWHGIKRFDDAINQLFGYATWKDTKTALIVFNKENKDFGFIRQTVLDWIKKNTKCHSLLFDNVWKCVIHRSDTNADVQAVIALYDLTL